MRSQCGNIYVSCNMNLIMFLDWYMKVPLIRYHCPISGDLGHIGTTLFAGKRLLKYRTKSLFQRKDLKIMNFPHIAQFFLQNDVKSHRNRILILVRLHIKLLPSSLLTPFKQSI